MFIVSIVNFIKKIISRLSKLDYDPRNSPLPNKPNIFPLSFSGMVVSFTTVDDYLWILVGDRSNGVEFKIFLDPSSVFPPIKGWQTFSHEDYMFLTTTVATRSITILVLLFILATMYAICSVILMIINFIFWFVKACFPVLFLFHFINKIRIDRNIFRKSRSTKKC